MRGLTNEEAYELSETIRGTSYLVGDNDDPQWDVLLTLTRRGLLSLEIIPYHDNPELDSRWTWEITSLGRLALQIYNTVNSGIFV
jgi:hypothetical protein